MNVEKARFNMVEQQIRPWEVLDQQVLNAIMAVPREKFVPAEYQALAFADINIPLVHGQSMLSPKLEGRVVQSLFLQATDRVLEIGTGNGYLTALLAQLANHVESVDIYPELTQAASANLSAAGISNVLLKTGDAINGWNPDMLYDAIVLGGSVPVLKPHFQQQLKVGGRLFAIVGEKPVMEALLITRTAQEEWVTESLFETVVDSLVGAPTATPFVL